MECFSYFQVHTVNFVQYRKEKKKQSVLRFSVDRRRVILYLVHPLHSCSVASPSEGLVLGRHITNRQYQMWLARYRSLAFNGAKLLVAINFRSLLGTLTEAL